MERVPYEGLLKAGTVLNYKRPYVHPEGSLSKADTDSSFCEAQ